MSYKTSCVKFDEFSRRNSSINFLKKGRSEVEELNIAQITKIYNFSMVYLSAKGSHKKYKCCFRCYCIYVRLTTTVEPLLMKLVDS